MEFSFTTVSVSEDAIMPTKVVIPKTVKIIPARKMPKKLASVNLKNLQCCNYIVIYGIIENVRRDYFEKKNYKCS